jgi:hypothetical protein
MNAATQGFFPSTARTSADACEIPTEAVSIVVSTTVVRAHSKGWLITYPPLASRPNAATLNWNQGTTHANTARVALGADRQNAVYRYGGFGNGDAVINVVGAFVPADSATSGRFVSAPVPQRLLDTRDEDGIAVGPDTAVRIPLPPGVPTDASALAINPQRLGDTRAETYPLYPDGTVEISLPDRAGQPAAVAIPTKGTTAPPRSTHSTTTSSDSMPQTTTTSSQWSGASSCATHRSGCTRTASTSIGTGAWQR